MARIFAHVLWLYVNKADAMRNEMRISAAISVVIIGVLAVTGIISYVIMKRRRKGVEAIETDQETIDVNPNSRLRQNLSTRSRHQKERNSLPINSKRIRLNKFQSSEQQMSNIGDEVGLFFLICAEALKTDEVFQLSQNKLFLNYCF
ncbi:hypothetical protein X798_03293 [Onchocerca flexuosa]|uniref:Uncharacterized protein n=1 Tax=Onchocerca flexuosa TaxID=387005 RepID=A0A238BXY1_9BILA|nr:hypothetical protein X798_03293 [Onchocerca flexuosa]